MGLEMCSPVITPEALRMNITNEGGVAGTIRLLKNIAGLWLVQECRRRWQHRGSRLRLGRIVDGWHKRPNLCVRLSIRTVMTSSVRSICRRQSDPTATGPAKPEPETPGQIIRCCLESLALKYRHVLDLLKSLTGRMCGQSGSSEAVPKTGCFHSSLPMRAAAAW